ncbi:hypothetical protein LO763_15500 [Glycomyces sp. A-F 0318]|uniref:hypothetical protein n=1 Tax=Glycomyces amatae TaxID=2881355 RepID=UPI001E398AC6|nr:hypothetical protein [Glycomyces amatae]MCD0445021.1 hypothetical protein [Glycomyces amatae]
MTSSHRRLLGAFALLAVFAGAACGTGSDATGDASQAPESGAEPTAESTPSEEAAPTAADGTDYAACDDGSCEVVVSGDPVEFAFADFTLTVTITPDGIETDTASSDGTRSGNSSMSGEGMADAYCVAYLTAGSNTMNCYPDTDPGDVAPPEPESGVLVLEMLDFEEGTAVIRLAMG